MTDRTTVTDSRGVSAQVAASQAKEMVQQIVDRQEKGASHREGHQKGEHDKGDPKVLSAVLPAWMKYYNRQIQDRSTHYGRGAAREFDYFEKSLMKNYINDKDRFFDLVGQNPEVCALIYPDQSRKIQIVHHLTTAVHGRSMIVGVEGLGSVSEVKSINMSVFSDEIELGELDAIKEVPTFTEFMHQSLDDIQVNDATDGSQRITLDRFLKGVPSGFMVHKKPWQ